MVEPVVNRVRIFARNTQLPRISALPNRNDDPARAVNALARGDFEIQFAAPRNAGDAFVNAYIEPAHLDVVAPAQNQIFLAGLFQPQATHRRPIRGFGVNPLALR